MLHGAMSPSITRTLLAGVGAVLMVACGSDVQKVVTAPEPVAAPAPADSGGSVTASAVPSAIGVASCDFVNPTGYSLSLSGSSSISTSGNETLQCRGGVSPVPTRLLFYSGFSCYLPQTADWTSNSQLSLRTNGSASLTCKAK